jgi:hypothetical protein
MPPWSRLWAAVVALLLLALMAGCGSSSSRSAARHARPGGVAAHRHAGSSRSSANGRIHATFVGANHDPKIIANWPYTVTATDAHGAPLSGSVLVEFTFGGAVVGKDRSGTHHLRNGRWHDTLNFPPEAVGEPLTLVAILHTKLGTIKLDWAVTPKK